jgi:hypothetical protein
MTIPTPCGMGMEKVTVVIRRLRLHRHMGRPTPGDSKERA